MMSKRKILFPLFAIVVSLTFLSVAQPAFAISFEDIVTGAKTFLLGGEKKEVKVDTKIDLVSEGDLNKKGQIDAGDTIKYSFILTNTTNTTYNSAKLNTNISTKEINSIRNIKGILSLDDSKNTVILPNITLNPNQVRKISFEAKVNLYKDADKKISTEAELMDEKNSTISKTEKKEISIKKLDEETFNKFVHVTK